MSILFKIILDFVRIGFTIYNQLLNLFDMIFNYRYYEYNCFKH